MKTPMIIVHDLAQAKAALGAASNCGCKVILRSPPGSSAATGPGIFAEQIALARASHENGFGGALFDCGDQAGLAMAAVRRGGCDLLIDLPLETAAKIKDMAAQAGVRAIDKLDVDVLDLNATNTPGQAVTDFLEITSQ
jgi:hypothetical protein